VFAEQVKSQSFGDLSVPSPYLNVSSPKDFVESENARKTQDFTTIHDVHDMTESS
jgi:hypothetical protein